MPVGNRRSGERTAPAPRAEPVRGVGLARRDFQLARCSVRVRQKNTRTPKSTPRPGSTTVSLRNEVCTRATWSVRLLPSRNSS